MNTNIYKTEQGQQIIEQYYKNILSLYQVHPFEQIYVDTRVARTHILKFGNISNPPLLMLHGSTSNSAAWLGCISDFINDFCIYCIDIPGEPGLSEPKRCSMSTDEPITWMTSLLENLEIEKAYFLGMSLGSWYAMNFGLSHPDNIFALSMLTSAGFAPMKKSFILKAILSSIMGEAGKRILNKAIYHKTVVPDEVLIFQSLASVHFNPLMESIPVFTDEQLERIHFPLQFFGGDHDGLIDSIKTARKIHKICPHADVHILKDTGHAILDQFSNISEFFKSINV